MKKICECELFLCARPIFVLLLFGKIIETSGNKQQNVCFFLCVCGKKHASVILCLCLGGFLSKIMVGIISLLCSKIWVFYQRFYIFVVRMDFRDKSLNGAWKNIFDVLTIEKSSSLQTMNETKYFINNFHNSMKWWNLIVQLLYTEHCIIIIMGCNNSIKLWTVRFR